MAKERIFHRGSDAWGRGSYVIPARAVAGASDCGMCDDSPAPSNVSANEIAGLRHELRKHGIVGCRTRFTRSGNLFMVKRWLVAPVGRYDDAVSVAHNYLREHDRDTRLIHDADA